MHVCMHYQFNWLSLHFGKLFCCILLKRGKTNAHHELPHRPTDCCCTCLISSCHLRYSELSFSPASISASLMNQWVNTSYIMVEINTHTSSLLLAPSAAPGHPLSKWQQYSASPAVLCAERTSWIDNACTLHSTDLLLNQEQPVV